MNLRFLPPTAESDQALTLRDVCKRYRLYRSDFDRLLEIITRRERRQDVTALSGIDLRVRHGEVLGIIGRNGAGKSTLLKIIAGLLPPSEGGLVVNGRIGAILELGAAFHPEMSGRENVYLQAAIAGLDRATIDEVFPEIAAFADIGDFIERPVKTYSSGMSARLAFAVATAIDPDILIVDEALSVGDGAFARKSFDRMIAFHDAGKTILFCSHSLYQIESICTRAIWLDQGCIRMDGAPAEVLPCYREALEQATVTPPADTASSRPDDVATPGSILSVRVAADGREGLPAVLRSGRSDLTVRVQYRVQPSLPAPNVGVAIMSADRRPIAGAASHLDGTTLLMDAEGCGEALVRFPALPLLRGHYSVMAYLLCERGLHIYEECLIADAFRIEQGGLEAGVGYVSLRREWQAQPDCPAVGTHPSAS